MRIRRGSERKKGGPSMERWLLTYSDMITLLMIFFIMMYVISNVNAQKFQQLAEVLGAAFGSKNAAILENGNSILPNTASESTGDSQDLAQLKAIQNQLNAYLKQKGLDAKISVDLEERGLVISLQDTVLFDSGSAELTPGAKGIINSIGQMLKPVPNYLRIEGHTDNVPIHNSDYPSNWELSAARATNVVQQLISESGLPPSRLSATGYGEYRPRVSNDTTKNRQMNRRVDILILKQTLKEVEPDGQ
jgi:chemotaxis protein MotB